MSAIPWPKLADVAKAGQPPAILMFSGYLYQGWPTLPRLAGCLHEAKTKGWRALHWLPKLAWAGITPVAKLASEGRLWRLVGVLSHGHPTFL